MNRILLDDRKNIIINEKDNKKVIDVKDDLKIFINDISCKYIFNVYDSVLDIYGVFEKKYDLNIEFNIYGGCVVCNCINFSGKNERIIANLNKDNSKVEIFNSVVSRNTQDIDVFINHNASYTISDIYNCASTINYGSVLFNVTSKVNKESIKCIVNQDSKIISLNDTNKNKINPILLIDEFDTEARHSAFIGKFSDEEVFYLQTRGLRKKDAYNLLLNGFLIGMLKITDEEKNILKEKISKDWR